MESFQERSSVEKTCSLIIKYSSVSLAGPLEATLKPVILWLVRVQYYKQHYFDNFK